MAWARASQLDRAVMCPGSTHLPRVADETSDAAAWGNLVHEWKETGKWPVNTIATRRRQAALLATDLSREVLWPTSSGTHEVCYALHTANRIVSSFTGTPEEREAWKASFDDNWLTGTADWVGDFLGDVWVDDLKTGKEVPSNPWDLWQLRFYALCATMLSNAERARVSILHWPRYPADDPPRPRKWTTVTREELMGTTLPLLEHARQEAARSKRHSLPVVSEGAHCTYCRSWNYCPAKEL